MGVLNYEGLITSGQGDDGWTLDGRDHAPGRSQSLSEHQARGFLDYRLCRSGLRFNLHQ